jgi:hypothetical protein
MDDYEKSNFIYDTLEVEHSSNFIIFGFYKNKKQILTNKTNKKQEEKKKFSIKIVFFIIYILYHDINGWLFH